MTGTKQILLAGFAALCMVLPACRSTTSTESVDAPPPVVSSQPLTTVSYTAEYSQDGALPFTCEVKLGTDGRIRRDYIWKDEKGAEKKVSDVIDGEKAVRLESGKSVPITDADTAKARFFAGLVLSPDSVGSNARRMKETKMVFAIEGDDSIPCRIYSLELAGLPGMGRCIVATDPENDRWSALFVKTADDFGKDVSTGFREYKTESGVTYPSQIVSSTEGGAPVYCTIRDVKINPELPDELFSLPDNNG